LVWSSQEVDTANCLNYFQVNWGFCGLKFASQEVLFLPHNLAKILRRSEASEEHTRCHLFTAIKFLVGCLHRKWA